MARARRAPSDITAAQLCDELESELPIDMPTPRRIELIVETNLHGGIREKREVTRLTDVREILELGTEHPSD